MDVTSQPITSSASRLCLRTWTEGATVHRCRGDKNHGYECLCSCGTYKKIITPKDVQDARAARRESHRP